MVHKIFSLTNGSARGGYKSCVSKCTNSGDKIRAGEATFGNEMGKPCHDEDAMGTHLIPVVMAT